MPVIPVPPPRVIHATAAGGFWAACVPGSARSDSCCDGGCSSGCSGGCSGTPVTMPAKTPEKIDANPTKKMPIDTPKDKLKKSTEEVRFETQTAPFAPNAIQVTPAIPNVEVVPVPARASTMAVAAIPSESP